METEEKFRRLLDAYGNRTKLSILFLLAENERMTVTQMAKHIDVSRSNLYHFVSQLVDDQILNEPEVVPKKNYVEKYYTLNQELFSSAQWDELETQFSSMNTVEVRSLLRAYLIGQAFNLQLLAEKLEFSSDIQIEKFKQALLNKTAFLTYSVSHVGDHPGMMDKLAEAMDELEKSVPEKEHKSRDVVRALIMVLPYI